MSTSTVSTIIEGFANDLAGIVYAVIPDVLVVVAILMGITLGVRYVRRWIFKSAK